MWDCDKDINKNLKNYTIAYTKHILSLLKWTLGFIPNEVLLLLVFLPGCVLGSGCGSRVFELDTWGYGICPFSVGCHGLFHCSVTVCLECLIAVVELCWTARHEWSCDFNMVALFSGPVPNTSYALMVSWTYNGCHVHMSVKFMRP